MVFKLVFRMPHFTQRFSANLYKSQGDVCLRPIFYAEVMWATVGSGLISLCGAPLCDVSGLLDDPSLPVGSCVNAALIGN